MSEDICNTPWVKFAYSMLQVHRALLCHMLKLQLSEYLRKNTSINSASSLFLSFL